MTVYTSNERSIQPLDIKVVMIEMSDFITDDR